MSLNKTTTNGWLVTGQNCSRCSQRSLPSTGPGLGHADDLSQLNCPVAGGRRFSPSNSAVIRSASISCLTLSMSCSFNRRTSKGSFMARAPSPNINIAIDRVSSLRLWIGAQFNRAAGVCSSKRRTKSTHSTRSTVETLPLESAFSTKPRRSSLRSPSWLRGRWSFPQPRTRVNIGFGISHDFHSFD
jgi:hypothetical protein